MDRDFGSLLNAISILPTDNSDHPLWAFVDYLAQLVFYRPGSQDADSITPLRRIWSYTSKILAWVQKQQQVSFRPEILIVVLIYTHEKHIKEMNTSLHIDYEQKLDNIVDTIYQQILYVESTPDGPVVTLYPPFFVAIKNSYLIPLSIPALSRYSRDITEPLRLSHDILLVKGIHPSLEKYLTCPTRAREMYISKDHFHTQLAEMWLDKLFVDLEIGNPKYVFSHYDIFLFPFDDIYDFNSPRIEVTISEVPLDLLDQIDYSLDSRGKEYKIHLVRASGTVKLFARLRVLTSRSFSKPRSFHLQEIIGWLEVSLPPTVTNLSY